ncbi:MAG: DUF4266 domain-containing protein [Candidatus Eisenbacteria bacterium]
MKSPRVQERRLLILALSALLLSGCASMDVQPWDRDLLAEEAMSFSPEPMVTAIDNHIYFSKEGSTGGQEVGGGGCGCN